MKIEEVELCSESFSMKKFNQHNKGKKFYFKVSSISDNLLLKSSELCGKLYKKGDYGIGFERDYLHDNQFVGMCADSQEEAKNQLIVLLVKLDMCDSVELLVSI